MALCRAYGNPDLFITFTSNLKWPEIAKMLAYFTGQKAHDRPEVGTRIFKLKLTELLDNLTKKHVFGQFEAEFQKRGLPHAHILLWLEEHSKCKTPSEIDYIISVELPSLTYDLAAYKVVTEYMLHGPCGKDARYATCTTDGKCSKHFPKPFLAETFLDEEGYPHYRQRDNKVTIKKGKFTYDNKHVVPHNRYLLLKYNAHINVEWCNRSKAIKYLFKYLNKGPDRATIVIQENVKNGNTLTTEHVSEVDEIKNYLNCRFLAPCEAVWHLFSFDIHYSYPTVMQLSFHLPNQNAITLRDSENLPALLQREGIDVTMFTDWFELNKRDPAARTHTYADIPKHYVWHEQKKLWLPRKQRKCIGRIVYSSPASGERYYLRMLLNVVRGVTGFEHLMTVNHRLYATFKEVCFAYGLLNDDREWTKALSEASLWALGPQMRDIFITMLLFCDVARPLKLWETNWQALSEDILHKKQKLYKYPELQLTDEQIRNYCLIEIQELLRRFGRSLTDFKDLPQPNPNLLTNMDNRTGKTFLYQTIISRLRSERRIVLAVASSGVASLLLPAGRTAHSRQILLVIPKAKRPEIVQACINRSELWNYCKDSPIQQIVTETYPDFTSRQTDDEYLKEREILIPRNDDAEAINEFMFKQLSGEPVAHYSADEICKASTDNIDQHQLYPIEFLNSFNFPDMSPHALCLKKELPIMLIRNVNLSQGLCNGTRLIITDLGQFVIRTKILTGSHIGDEV
ncbi:uncharacterized protein Tco_0336062 [Tanacetum coccineum]